MTADIILYDRLSRPLLVCEVKAVRNADPSWAAKLRRNLIVNGLVPDAPYFLLVLPTKTYLWRDAPAGEAVLPAYEGATWEIFNSFLSRFDEQTTRLSESGLELATRAWLDRITSPPAKKTFTPSEEELLHRSGLAERAQLGTLVYGDAA
jgi:hypothetical protein